MHKYAKPLTGYVEDEDLIRLENLRKKVFTGQGNKRQRYKSADINVENKEQFHRLSSLGVL